jgi:hypothetical protein
LVTKEINKAGIQDNKGVNRVLGLLTNAVSRDFQNNGVPHVTAVSGNLLDGPPATRPLLLVQQGGKAFLIDPYSASGDHYPPSRVSLTNPNIEPAMAAAQVLPKDLPRVRDEIERRNHDYNPTLWPRPEVLRVRVANNNGGETEYLLISPVKGQKEVLTPAGEPFSDVAAWAKGRPFTIE